MAIESNEPRPTLTSEPKVSYVQRLVDDASEANERSYMFTRALVKDILEASQNDAEACKKDAAYSRLELGLRSWAAQDHRHSVTGREGL